MGQQFFLNENDLNVTFERLRKHLYEMEEFAYIHEERVSMIEDLIDEWARNNLTVEYQKLLDQWDEMSEDPADYNTKSGYDNRDDWFDQNYNRWWAEVFTDLQVELKKKFIERVRLTIGVCLSDGYTPGRDCLTSGYSWSDDDFKKEVDRCWEEEFES
jgi:hypothetical protein